MNFVKTSEDCKLGKFLVNGKGRGRPAILNRILTLLKALWRKQLFLVSEIVRGIFRNH